MPLMSPLMSSATTLLAGRPGEAKGTMQAHTAVTHQEGLLENAGSQDRHGSSGLALQPAVRQVRKTGQVPGRTAIGAEH